MSTRDEAYENAVRLIRTICSRAGSMTFLDDMIHDAEAAKMPLAVAERDTPRIFDWLLTTFSYQGVSDQAARTYILQNGKANWLDVEASLRRPQGCSRLRSYWHYEGCRYDKGSFTCSEPDHIESCPVPRARLRNGRLNQTAYSFYFFVRDVAQGDLVGWIDEQLNDPNVDTTIAAKVSLQERLLGPLRNVYGVSDKILTMTLSGLLLGAADSRPEWFEAGRDMVAIDSLVHNFLHRTGILDNFGAPHKYGAGCYAAGGCADIIKSVSQLIDARAFNPAYPQVFPRFVQHAVWRFCAADGLDICNGNRIDDRYSCENAYCQVYNLCKQKSLKTT